MRQNIAEGFELKGNKHPFIFENPDGHAIKIMVVSSGMIRVQYFTPSEYDRGKEGKLQENPMFNVRLSIKDEDKIEIGTSIIRLVVILNPAFHLVWYSNDEEEEPFAEDLAYRSYGYGECSGEKWHYQKKFEETTYYGLGERSGSLDLSGRRFRLERLDCMGYDAETSDPLYKFCPFYINLSSRTKNAYGVYYNNFSNTTIDLGQELDAVICL